jgi:WD40 repeat protein
LADTRQHQSSSEDFMQRPWIGAVQQPKVVPSQISGSPKIGLRLDWVYGYNSQDTRNNLFYTCESANSGIVYHAAAIGIVLKNVAPGKGGSSTGQNDDGTPARLCLKQMFHEGHDDDISCLTISQDRQFVATGQVGSKPIIQIWHAVSCANLCTFPAFHERGIADLAFSQDKDGGSRQLLSVGQGDNHLHAVWRDTGGHWSKVAMVASARGDGAKVRAARHISAVLF